MRDDFLTRDYADQHRALSRTVHKLVHRAGIAFERLVAQQYAAPWRAAGVRAKAYRTPATPR